MDFGEFLLDVCASEGRVELPVVELRSREEYAGPLAAGRWVGSGDAGCDVQGEGWFMGCWTQGLLGNGYQVEEEVVTELVLSGVGAFPMVGP